MTTPLTAEQVLAIGLVPADEMPLMIAEDPSVITGLIASHEALRVRAAAADNLTNALRHYAVLDPDEVPYRWTINDDPDIGYVARAALAAYDAAKETT